jgi:hypothetical protein
MKFTRAAAAAIGTQAEVAEHTTDTGPMAKPKEKAPPIIRSFARLPTVLMSAR